MNDLELTTDLELKVIGGACMGLSNREIAQQLGMAQDVVQHAMYTVYDKTGVSNRLELILWVRTAVRRCLPQPAREREDVGPEQT